MLSISGEKMAIAGTVSPEFGMWMASLILLPIAIFVTVKANADSPIMITAVFQKLIGIRKKKDENSNINLLIKWLIVVL